MATGEIIGERKVRYTFKEYVQEKKDLTAELSLNLFIDPTTVTQKVTKMLKLNWVRLRLAKYLIFNI